MGGRHTGELNRLMGESDVAVVSAPLNEHRVGMIDPEQPERLGTDGVLINVGRAADIADNIGRLQRGSHCVTSSTAEYATCSCVS